MKTELSFYIFKYMDKSEILDSLFDKGYVTKKVEVIPDKKYAWVSNLKVKDQMEIEKEMSEIEGNAIYTVHSYTLKLLSVTLKEWDGEPIKSRQDAMDIIDNLPSRLIDKLTREQQELENEISDALNIKDIKQNFSQGAEALQGSEQSQEA